MIGRRNVSTIFFLVLQDKTGDPHSPSEDLNPSWFKSLQDTIHH
jgi:hypothetical protein